MYRDNEVSAGTELFRKLTTLLYTATSLFTLRMIVRKKSEKQSALYNDLWQRKVC